MKPFFAIALVAVLAAGTSARAGQNSDDAALRARLAQCATVQDALQRLECYDRLARQLEPASPKSTLHSESSVPPPAQPASAAPTSELPPPEGKWERKIERDDKGKITKATLRLTAASEKGGIGGDPVTLVLRCLDNETSVTIDWQNHVGNDSVPVTLHVDDSAGVRTLWQVSANASQTIYTGNAAELIRGWSGAHTLQAHLSPYGGYAMTATFDLAGLAGTLAPLRTTCHW